MNTRFLKTGVMLALGTFLGCSDTSALGPGEATGDVTITLQRTAVLSAGVVAAEVATAPEGKVPGDQVKSLRVTITSIEMLKECEADDGDPADGECDENGGWIALVLDDSVTVDLVALPEPHEPPVVIASGSVLVGSYRKVRLFVQDEIVIFAESFTVGNWAYDMGEEYEVTIPSGDNTGIKTDLSFTVTEDAEGNAEEVNLLFDSEASFRGVTATGNGKVMLPPVLKVKPTDSA
jgi:hypothetical protein